MVQDGSTSVLVVASKLRTMNSEITMITEREKWKTTQATHGVTSCRI